MKTMMFSALLLFALATRSSADEKTVKLFKAQCATCHGVDGKGQTTAGKKLNVKDWGDGKTLNKLSDADVEKAIRTGKNGDDGKELMPSFAKLDAEKIKALTAYLRTFQK